MPGGRPTKFTPETRAKIIEAIRKGAPYEIACNYARVDYSNFRKWLLKADEEGGEEYQEFREQIKEAEGETALKWLDVIDNAMAKEWTTAAWKLERRHFRHFSANPVVREEFRQLEADVKALKQKHGEYHARNAKEVDSENENEEGSIA